MKGAWPHLREEIQMLQRSWCPRDLLILFPERPRGIPLPLLLGVLTLRLSDKEIKPHIFESPEALCLFVTEA